ncbi:MAG: hypothetical protein AMXMBFR4_31480 [Candidatus Hydrogenedentota bacterium]
MPRDPSEAEREDRIRMMHMLEAACRVKRYCQGMDRETLERDEMRFLAVVKSIEMIGEAAAKVSATTQTRLSTIDWRGILRMRNRLIHGYDTVDPARVWDAVELDIPGLIAALSKELGVESTAREGEERA